MTRSLLTKEKIPNNFICFGVYFDIVNDMKRVQRGTMTEKVWAVLMEIKHHHLLPLITILIEPRYLSVGIFSKWLVGYWMKFEKLTKEIPKTKNIWWRVWWITVNGRFKRSRSKCFRGCQSSESFFISLSRWQIVQTFVLCFHQYASTGNKKDL